MLNELLLKLIVSASLPFSIVRNPNFTKFLQALRPSYKIPSSTTLRDSLLFKVWSKEKTKFQDHIKFSPDISIILGADGWTDIAGRSIFGVVAILISDRPRTFLLRLKDISQERHTSDNLKKVMLEVLSEIVHKSVNAIVLPTLSK